MSAIQDNDIRNIIRKYIEDSYLPTVILNEDQSRLVESYNTVDYKHRALATNTKE